MTRKLEFNNYEPVDLLLILVAADEMNIEGIVKYLLQHLIDNYQDYLLKDPLHTSKCITGNISRVDPGESDRAILYNRKFGPSFGGAPNLALTNNQVYCYNSNAYPGSESFISVGLTEMANYEVFQIIEIKNH
ncbi:13831_t:CDS:2 [Funneliformis caledonium]|uniref:13831_t:CDS:1 n=1 Tax=Funneliformis caledonium TaxID=1117310 RepID=A0A9N9DSJ0_9GLOM|nr:13831_t:CDS:2 [Funneliformis caledonium]